MIRGKPISGLLIVLLSVLLAFACSNPLVTRDGGAAEEKRISSKVTDALGFTHETGVLGPGAQYEIHVPPGWELGHRGLVLYVHGYQNPVSPVVIPNDTDPFEAILLVQGFAVAYSSFSENGWAVKDGAIRTRQLRGYFVGAYGTPGKVYLIGASEGGIISIMLAEKNPDLFDGVLSIGGPIGGAQMEVKYIYNLRILFDYFFRNELLALAVSDPVAAALVQALGSGALAADGAGTILQSEGEAFAQQVAPRILSVFALSMNPPWGPPQGGPPQGLKELLAMATMTVKDKDDAFAKPMFNWPPAMFVPPAPSLPPPFVMELAATIATGLWYNLFGTEDLLDRTHEHVPVDNTLSVYASPVPYLSDLENQALNAGVERLAARQDALKYLEHWYQPTGKLSIPVVVLHTKRDPIVPVFHAEVYQQLVEASGSSGLLHQIVLDNFGHCQILNQVFPPAPPWFVADEATFAAQLQGAFNYLVVWSASMP
jgi:pimeloyl-ACP methyl ester carboxylesterase